MNEDFVLQVYNDRLLDYQYAKTARGIAYALHLRSSGIYEVEEFINNPLHSTPRYRKCLDDIMARLEAMCLDGNFQPTFFKPEDGYYALPRSGGELRLYSYIINSQTAILGGGGIKNKGTRTIQESAILSPKRLIMKELDRRLLCMLNEDFFTNPLSGGLYDQFGNLIKTITLKSPN